MTDPTPLTAQTEGEFEAAMPISGTVETFFGDFATTSPDNRRTTHWRLVA